MKRAILLVLIAAGLLAGCGEKTPKIPIPAEPLR